MKKRERKREEEEGREGGTKGALAAPLKQILVIWPL
jgi:hypothetical protein